MVITELIKQRTNAGSDNPLYYWREKSGHEIDVITENGHNLIALEIKSGKTITSDYFRNLHYWKKLSNSDEGHILYAGDQYQKRSDGIEVLNWRTYLLSAAN
jgi:hypothetical protein